MEVDTHHAAISAAVTDPSDMRTVPSQTSSGARASDHGFKRRYGMALVTNVAEQSATRALEEEICISGTFVLSTMLLLTESTLYWLNLIWNIGAPNRRTLLRRRVNNWANTVTRGSTPSQKSDSTSTQVDESSIPSLTTDTTAHSSATSETTHKNAPVLSGLPNSLQIEALPVQIAGHRTKVSLCKIDVPHST